MLNQLVSGLCAALASGLVLAGMARADVISLPMTSVGNPGSAGDHAPMYDGVTGTGEVAYPFEVGTYEVTNTEYVAFLNSVAVIDDPNGLYTPSMESTFNGGIVRTGVPGSYVYNAKPGYENKPVLYVSFVDAARFANWLHNGQPTGSQSVATTEDGAYTLLGPTEIADGNLDGNGRNFGWQWAIPNQHEWHKAAYGHEGDAFTRYPTRFFDRPWATLPPGDENSGNFADVAPELTERGAYGLAHSFWGTFDQGGNLSELTEGWYQQDLRRRYRGGNWSGIADWALSVEPGVVLDNDFENNRFGFRVVRAVNLLDTGACCLPSGSCVSGVDANWCAGSGGVFEGIGTDCDGDPCGSIVGACCVPGPDCYDGMTQIGCEAVGGIYVGDGSLCAGAACVPVGPTIYVNWQASAGGSGADWVTAFNTLQDALLASGTGDQIWVAAGTYYPDLGGGEVEGDQEATFELPSGVMLLGGFLGDELNPIDRDPVNNVTVMSGDIGVPGDHTDNTNSLMRMVNANDDTLLDGFTLTFARSVGSGGGAALRVESGSSGWPTIARCRFEENAAVQQGGAVSLFGPALITDCVFTGNSAGTRGGGLHGSNGELIRCTFEGNSADVGGGAFSGGILDIRDCVFVGNSATDGGGLAASDDVYIHSCYFESNDAVDDGGGLYVFGNSNVQLVSYCTFVDNTATLGGGFANRRGGTSRFVGCEFYGNQAASGGGFADAGFSIQADCLYVGNSAVTEGGGLWKTGTSLGVITNATFVGNSAGVVGGGLSAITDVSLANSIFWQNDVGGDQSEASQIAASDPITVDYTCIQGLTGGFGGAGNIAADPQFTDADGADDILGTLDDDLRLLPTSPCIDAGDNGAVPQDYIDLDGDGDSDEPVPFDLDKNERFLDIGAVADTGVGTPPIVDLGAYELDLNEDPLGTYIGLFDGSWFDAVNWQGSFLPVASTSVVIGTSVVVDQVGAVASSVTVLSSGVLRITNGSLATPLLLIQSGGILQLEDPAALLEVERLVLASGASVVWTAGTIHLTTGGLWNTLGEPLTVGCSGSATLQLGSGASVIAPSLQICAQGAVTGIGNVYADVVNDGVVVPGDSPGVLTIWGDYEQSLAGLLDIEVLDIQPGTGHDQLLVLGVATVNGTVEVTLGPGFNPTLASALHIVVAETINGAFAVEILPALPGDLIFTMTYNVDLPIGNDRAIDLVTSLTATGPRLFVDATATGGDAQGWATAVKELHTAISVAELFPGVVSEIWVAAGSYRPDAATLGRAATFRMHNGVAIYGGFNGTEIDLSERDVLANVAILTGDLLDNDEAGASFFHPSFDDNSYHVVTATGTDATAVLDGVHVVRGLADNDQGVESGAGIFIESGSPTIANCTFNLNQATESGGAIFIDGGDPTFTNCVFDANATEWNKHGGAMAVANSTAIVSGCDFIGNAAHGGGDGGALFLDSGSNLTVSNCAFDNNEGDSGAAIYIISSSPQISLCSFTSNQGFDGGAIGMAFASPTLSDCTFTANTVITDGGAVLTSVSPAIFVDCVFTSNTAGGHGGAVANRGAAVVQYTNCQFIGNNSEDRGGGAYCDTNNRTTFEDCLFDLNTTNGDGGGLHTFLVETTVNNCVFTGNSAAMGGGVFVWRGAMTFNGGSMNGNSSPFGSGIFNLSGDVLGGIDLQGADIFWNSGHVYPGVDTNPLMIAGTFSQHQTHDFDYHIPRIMLNVAGLQAGTDYGVLQVGTGDLAGTLLVSAVDGFVPLEGDTYQAVDSPALVRPFDVAQFPGLPAGLRLVVDNDPVSGVTVRVEAASDPIEFDDAIGSAALMPLIDTAVGDLDGDGDLDLILLIDMSTLPGFIAVLRNEGVDGNGDWLGFFAMPVVLTGGNSPVQIAIGQFNPGDTAPDLAIVDSDASSVTILLNRNDGSALFNVAPPVLLDQPAGQVATGRVVGGVVDDLIISWWFNGGEVRLLENDGTGSFTESASLVVDGNHSRELNLADMNGDQHDDLITLGTPGGVGLQVYLYEPGAGNFLAPMVYDVNDEPIDLLIDDLNSDGAPDAAVISFFGEELILLINRNDGTGALTVSGAIDLGAGPRAIGSLDADADGDRDLVVVERPLGAVRVKLVPNGLDGGETIVLSSVDLVTDQGDARFAFGGDVNNDGADDLILVEESTVGPGAFGGITVKLATATLACVGDIDGSGDVGFTDLVNLLASWGPCPSCCPADLDCDGIVGFADLVTLLSVWGLCPS